jgi:hypothetical protein
VFQCVLLIRRPPADEFEVRGERLREAQTSSHLHGRSGLAHPGRPDDRTLALHAHGAADHLEPRAYPRKASGANLLLWAVPGVAGEGR